MSIMATNALAERDVEDLLPACAALVAQAWNAPKRYGPNQPRTSRDIKRPWLARRNRTR
jgi:hypothetical protein